MSLVPFFRSQCSSLSDDREMATAEEENFDGYGANEDVEYER